MAKNKMATHSKIRDFVRFSNGKNKMATKSFENKTNLSGFRMVSHLVLGIRKLGKWLWFSNGSLA
jgi:hypothetical protein